MTAPQNLVVSNVPMKRIRHRKEKQKRKRKKNNAGLSKTTQRVFYFIF